MSESLKSKNTESDPRDPFDPERLRVRDPSPCLTNREVDPALFDPKRLQLPPDFFKTQLEKQRERAASFVFLVGLGF